MKQNTKKYLIALFWCGLCCFCGAIMIASAAYLYLSPQLPSAETYRHVRLETPLRIYTADHKLIDEIGIRRDPVTYDEIPPMMINAVIASEDPRFYSHPGVDVKGLLRGFYGFIKGVNLGGGSTITMQLANNISFEEDNVYARKLKEIPFAVRIQRELSKEEILTLYLNLIYFGAGAEGINAAAHAYYGKPISELGLPQFAMMVSLLPCPSPCNPVADPERALGRRNVVLNKMLEQGMIDPQMHQEAINAPVTASRHSRNIEVSAPYVAEMVRRELYSKHGEDTYRSGFDVITSIHSEKQIAAQAAVVNGLEEHYDRGHGYRGPLNHFAPLGEDPTENWLQQLQGVPVYGNQQPAIVTAVADRSLEILLKDGSLASIEWSGLEWARPYITQSNAWPPPQQASDVAAVGDLITAKQAEDGSWSLGQIPDVQAALVSVSPDNGDILALVGGYDFGASQVNRVTTPRPPGSNFKPFVYGAALDQGYSAASTINDAPLTRGDYRPNNYENNFLGPVTLRFALKESRNVPAVRLYDQLTPSVVLPFAARFGFDTSTFPRNDLTVALGSQDVTPLELAIAYAAIANGGYKVDPVLIKKITNFSAGTVEYTPQAVVCEDCGPADKSSPSGITDISDEIPENGAPETGSAAQTAVRNAVITPAPRIVDARVAYILNTMLRSVIEEGSGRRVNREIGRSDLMGKTGTTNGPTELWFSGFNRDIVTSVFIGFDTPRPLGESEQGATVAVPIWIDYMTSALAGLPENIMDRPDGLVDRLINKTTGKSARPGQPDTMFEVFRVENAPAETGSQLIPVDRNDGSENVSTETIF